MPNASTNTPHAPRTLRFAQLPPFPLECGEQLPHATVAYHLDGEINARWSGNASASPTV